MTLPHSTSQYMPDTMSKYRQIDCPVECQKDCEIACHRCQLDCQNVCQVACQMACQLECHEECQGLCQKECRTECRNICQIQCQIRCQIKCQIPCQYICEQPCQIGTSACCSGGGPWWFLTFGISSRTPSLPGCCCDFTPYPPQSCSCRTRDETFKANTPGCNCDRTSFATAGMSILRSPAHSIASTLLLSLSHSWHRAAPPPLQRPVLLQRLPLWCLLLRLLRRLALLLCR